MVFNLFDIWSEIISYLRSKDVLELSCTCRAFNDMELGKEWLLRGGCVALDNEVVLRDFLARNKNLVRELVLRVEAASNLLQLNECPSLTSLKVDRAPKDGRISLRSLSAQQEFHLTGIRSCRSLTQITLVCWNLPKLADLDTLAFLPVLTSVKIHDCVLDGLDCLRSCMTLKRLDLINVDFLRDIDFLPSALFKLNLRSGERLRVLQVLACCTTLHTLQIQKGNRHIHDLRPLSSCPGLRSLSLPCSAIFDINPLSSCAGLCELKLFNCRQLVDIQPLTHCPELQTLNVGHTPLRDISSLASCPALTRLDLLGTNVIDVSPLANCRNLQEMRVRVLGASFDLTPLKACLELRMLELGGSVTETSLSALARIPTLKTLRICGQNHHSKLNEGVASLSQLHTIVLDRCHALSDITSLRSCVNLRELKVVECRNVIDLSPLEACTNLNRLVINGTTGLRDIAPLRRCLDLQNLWLYGLPELTDVEPLTGCQHLETINFSRTGVTDLLPLQHCMALREVVFVIGNSSIPEGVEILRKNGMTVDLREIHRH